MDTVERTPEAPALIDLHLHPGWTDFDPAARRRRSPEEARERIRTFLQKYAAAGIAAARDAGGCPEPCGRTGTRIVPCAGMLSGDDGEAEEEKTLSSAAVWVKIFATGGVGAAPEAATEPTMDRARFFSLVRRLHGRGKKVMVHTWGGDSLDWCVEAGVESVEHGVYLTAGQAYGLAQRRIPLIPTTSVYRLLAEKPELFGIPETLRERAKRACAAQPQAISRALTEGVIIGYGTDFYADPALADYARYELTTLRDCGLSERQALDAGTVTARGLLGL